MRYKASAGLVVIIIVGLLLPEHFSNPVNNSARADYNKDSFWYFPWGRSGTHKGVDIFAKEGQGVHASVSGIVVYAGNIEMGGNVVLILGPKWRLHYYAHLKTITTESFQFVSGNESIGTVGTTGNAAGKQPHLHYSIITLLPYVWQIDDDHQGWKKMFYLNPIPYLNDVHNR